jgi:hypothetical protein
MDSIIHFSPLPIFHFYLDVIRESHQCASAETQIPVSTYRPGETIEVETEELDTRSLHDRVWPQMVVRNNLASIATPVIMLQRNCEKTID